MSLSRRDFMRLFGVSVASLLLTRCRGLPFYPTTTCYAPLPPPTVTPSPASSVRERLRQYWLQFAEVARQAGSGGGTDYSLSLGEQMTGEHRAVLDELVNSGEVPSTVADLVQEAYEAAVYHVWRSNVPITCYEPMLVDYAPASAGVLVRQAEVLEGIAAQGTIDPLTLERARTAIEHDLAFYALSEADVQTLYERVLKEAQEAGQAVPSFDELPLDLTADARAAAQFIVDLLTGK